MEARVLTPVLETPHHPDVGPVAEGHDPIGQIIVYNAGALREVLLDGDQNHRSWPCFGCFMRHFDFSSGSLAGITPLSNLCFT